MSQAPKPRRIHHRRHSAVLEVDFDSGEHFELPAEYLRVFSPSAEVRGHGQAQLNLVPGKREVKIERIVPVGRYAIRLVFSDGHDTGLYSWDVLHDLGRNRDRYWAEYLERLERAGMSRDSDVVKLAALPKKYRPS